MANDSHESGANRTFSKGMFTRRQALPILTGTIGATLLARRAVAQTPQSVHGFEDADAPNNRGARVYNVRDYGAVGDGKTLATGAIQAAVNACTLDGGGTVLVPAGIFLIGTLELKTNVTLHIVAGGKLLGSGNGKDYHAVDAIPLRGDA